MCWAWEGLQRFPPPPSAGVCWEAAGLQGSLQESTCRNAPSGLHVTSCQADKLPQTEMWQQRGAG